MKVILQKIAQIRLQQALWLWIGLVLGLGLWRAAAWSESSAFCGLCHIMAPEIRAQAASAHTNVDCGDCHTPPGLIGFLAGKVSAIQEAWAYLTGQYALPIQAGPGDLPDTALTCERCHPRTSEDSPPQLVVVPRYLNDPANTRLNLYYTLDLDQVHWHVTHPVTYRVNAGIPWVTDGTRVYSTTSSMPDGPLVRMDCATCHNRSGHAYHPPAELLDAALARGALSTQVPYLRREALQALSAPYPDTASALASLGRFSASYREKYPTLYPSYEAELAQADQVLPHLYWLSFYPDYGIDSATYPDQSGHDAGAGCFRCHDGQHLATYGSRITQNCTACHGIPLLRSATDPVPSAPFLPPPQPASHQASDWINTHGQLKDESCAHCHAQEFCSNALCHGGVQRQP